MDEQFDGFESLGFTPATWDTFKTHYYLKIDSTTSRGRFSAIMSHFTLALRDNHTYAFDNVVLNTPLNPKVPLMILGGWINVEHFGAVVTCLPDSSVMILRVVDNHPLNLEPGDIIVGYDGVKWKDIFEELMEAELPILPTGGGSISSYRHEIFLSAGMSWHLFDTIDILKQSTGDTLHLSVAPLLNFNSPPILNNEQLEISNIPFPAYWSGERVTYGIIQNTNIGYVYVFAEWPTAIAEQQFKEAIIALQNTDGLVIDMRWNEGGWALWHEAFAILSNELEYSLNDVLRCSPSNWNMCPTGDSVSYKISGEPPDLYDRPIAVLLGPTCVSMGDINTNRLKYLSTTRIFGKSSAASYGWNNIISSFPNWTLRYSMGDMYHLRQPGNYLNRKELPLDYPIWFNPNDVANGYDTVVEEALEWINNLVYGHDVITDKGYASPGNDSITVSAIVENPNSHNILAKVYIKDLNNTLIDSLELFESESGELWQGKWLASNYEDIFKLDIKTTDQTTGESFTIENVNKITTAGPIAVDSISIVPHALPDFYEIYPHIKNEGQSFTVENLSIHLFTADSTVTILIGTLNLPSIEPGVTIIHPGHYTVQIDSNFAGAFRFNFEIRSDGWLYWEDSYPDSIISFVANEITLPTSYRLDQNYPNPFNPSTTIKYGITERTFVELRIYDILGREVELLVNKEQDAGFYELNFIAARLSSGIYFYQIKAGDFVETKKMVLLR